MKFLVFQHLDIEHPGIFREFWRRDGIEWTAVSFDQGDAIPANLDAFDALVVMGGPMDVWETEAHPWLLDEMAAIRRFVVELRKPFLGICLGHQLLAEALGGKVALAAAPEVGVYPLALTEAAHGDILFKGLSPPLTAFQWHSCEVAAPPPGAVVLAKSDLCAVQAFRWGGCAYGLQFHAEITEATPAEWASIPAYEQALEKTLGPGALAQVEAQTRPLLAGYRQTADHLSRQFTGLVQNADTRGLAGR